MKKAFTLIELLVVVLIIGILAAVALPQYKRAVDKAKFMQIVTASKAIVDAQQVYYMTNNVYAERADELSINYPLNEAGTKFVGEGWSCDFGYSNDGNASRSSCNLSSPDVVLQWYYKTKKIVCCAYASSQYNGDWLCRDVTQNTTPYLDNDFYRCYKGER
jgi:prepilin-type N-terminal cleavage/methylation domain-containing protein